MEFSYPYRYRIIVSLMLPEGYTVEELSRAGAALIDAGKMPQLLALLGKFGVQAVTQLPKEAYSAFGAELKALGAQL